MPLFRLLYRSDCDLTGSDRVMRDAAVTIADHASERNAAAGVSGGLMFIGRVFVQLLEGRRAAVEAVFERICSDHRHRNLVLLDFVPVEHRLFEGWSMVAFEGDRHFATLFPGPSEMMTSAYRNSVSASAAAQTMRDLLATRLSEVKMSSARPEAAEDHRLRHAAPI